MGAIFADGFAFEGYHVFFGVLAYSFQIYGDFSGGTDITRGAAQMMGIDLPVNFEQPFFATSMADFWHIIFDIKPYIPYGDCHPEATGGFTDRAGEFLLTVEFPEELLKKLPEDKQEAAMGVLSHDPRPSYQRKPDRIYGLTFAGYDIRFKVNEDLLTVVEVTRT